jgi:hypothetical protein
MAILLNDNLDIAVNKPTDSRYGPHTSTAAALSAIPSIKRYKGLTVGILSAGVVEDYWFRDDILDASLIAKTAGSGSGGTNATALQGKNIATTAPTAGQTLVWNSVTLVWEPSTPVPSTVVSGEVTGSTFTTFVGDDTADYFPINAYSTNNASSYLVSVGGVDQIPYTNYTVVDADGGTIIFTSPIPVGIVISIRTLLLKPASQTGSVTQLQGYSISSVAPVDGQVLTWNNVDARWEPGSVLITGGAVTFTDKSVHYFNVPATARWSRLQVASGAGDGVLDGSSVKINGVVTAAGGTGSTQGVSLDLPYNLTPFAGGQLLVEITAGAGIASVTFNW